MGQPVARLTDRVIQLVDRQAELFKLSDRSPMLFPLRRRRQFRLDDAEFDATIHQRMWSGRAIRRILARDAR